MPNDKFSFQTLGFSSRNQFSLVIILAACCILQACNSGQNKKINNVDTTNAANTIGNDSTVLAKKFLSQVCIESNLHILYAQTSDILNLYKHRHVSKIGKIVFDIYWENGVFTLATFDGGKKLGKTDYGKNKSPLVLQVSSEFPDPKKEDYDLNNKNVLLSDQELNANNDENSGNDDISGLYDYITGANGTKPDAFITFTPSIVLLATNIYTIQYQVGYADKEPLKLTWGGKTPTFTSYQPVPGVSATNPTPPRNSY